MNSIKLLLSVVLLAGCALGAEERRGADDTTEAQLPASPELYDEGEFEQASAEITRYDEATDKDAKPSDDRSKKAK